MKTSGFTCCIGFAFLILLGAYACSSPPPKKVKEVKPEKKLVKIKKEKPKKIRYIQDTITSENVVEFFTAYGKKNKENKVALHTRLGTITIRLYKNTPLHRASFIYLVKNKYFDTTCFYRIVPDFIVQGGNSDSEVTTEFRTQLNNYLIPAEFRKNRPHKRGVIAAARDWEYNPEKKSSAFEFYFIQATKSQSHLDFEHTVFGEIIDGIEVIDKIAASPIDTDEWPRKEISIKMNVVP